MLIWKQIFAILWNNQRSLKKIINDNYDIHTGDMPFSKQFNHNKSRDKIFKILQLLLHLQWVVGGGGGWCINKATTGKFSLPYKMV